MHSLRFDGTFATWRQAARRALLQGLAPHQLQWLDEEAAPGLFDQPAERAPQPSGRLRVSPELLDLLESAAQYRGEERWSLLYRVLLSTTEKGDVVLDPFFGTGTTGAVAKRLGREWIGCEREKGYIDVARARIEAALPLDESALTIMQSARTQPKVAGLVAQAIERHQHLDRRRRLPCLGLGLVRRRLA